MIAHRPYLNISNGIKSLGTSDVDEQMVQEVEEYRVEVDIGLDIVHLGQ